MSLTKEQILAANDLAGKLVPVEVPEWSGTVHVRVMSGTLRDRFEAVVSKDTSNIRARLAAFTLCDEAGKTLFTEADIEALGGRSSTALDRVFAVAMKVNGIGKADVDELEGKSAATTSGLTASGSPASSG